MLGMIVNIVLNFILIPSMGINGAAIATLLAQIIIFGYMLLRVRDLIKIDLFSGFFIALVPTLIMGALIYLLFLEFNLVLIIFLGIVIYFFSYFSLSKILKIFHGKRNYIK